MIVKIRLSRKEVEHLKSYHSFTDECQIACDVLYKVQRQIDKRLKEYESKNRSASN